MTGSRPSQGSKRRRQSLTSSGRKVQRRAIAAPFSRPCPADAVERGAAFQLAALACGPYHEITSFLDTRSLGQTDKTCRFLRRQNNMMNGPWHNIGERAFYGMEIDEGGFSLFEAVNGKTQRDHDMLPLPELHEELLANILPYVTETNASLSCQTWKDYLYDALKLEPRIRFMQRMQEDGSAAFCYNALRPLGEDFEDLPKIKAWILIVLKICDRRVLATILLSSKKARTDLLGQEPTMLGPHKVSNTMESGQSSWIIFVARPWNQKKQLGRQR
eukprot:symbB.v1.2.004820.t1/scaffold279.1/size242841/5